MTETKNLENLIVEAANNNDIRALREISKQVQYVDFAESIEQIEEKLVLKIFRMLDEERATEIFVYLSDRHQEFIMDSFSSNEIKEIVEELYSDDIVDLIDNMPAQIVKKVLKATTKEQRREINSILKYEEDTAGGIMSVNLIEFKSTDTVEIAKKVIKRRHEEFDEVDDMFIVDADGKLLGSIEIKDLLLNEDSKTMEEIMTTKLVSVTFDTDQEIVGETFKRYDLNTMPVVDKQNKLVGIITVDDVIDVLVEETTEDIQKFAGINDADADYFETSVWKMFKARSFWLMAMLILGTITQILLIVFFDAYNMPTNTNSTDGPELLMLLLPMVLIVAGVAGTSGNQSAMMMVRSLTLRQVHKKEVGEILLKEFLVSILITIPLILINVLRLVFVYLVQYDGDISGSELWISIGTSSIGLFLSILIANILGTLLPLGAKLAKLDPTVASSPLVTTVVDIIAVATFLGIGLLFI
ncbi:magnesium transporter [Mesoplasma photuris]|uniref:magnesium transporter n=1 Tax=Mesoplasma photuris TaxID=217731 RepID=UPI0004E2699C|nr:magnesium transporter [Mesoplasma photuris]